MRTELTASQTNIIALGTELELYAAPGSELRLESKGRLYAKSGKRHTQGRSRSRLAYQERGAAFLREGIRQSLRARGVVHVQTAALNVMAVARPKADERPLEPHRYTVRHGRDMSHIIQLADQLATRGMTFESALARVVEDWGHMGRLDVVQRQCRLDALVPREEGQAPTGIDRKHVAQVSKEAMADLFAETPLDGSHFERKATVVKMRPKPAVGVEEQPQSAAQAAREAARLAQQQAGVQWHASAFDNLRVLPPSGPAERKHGPQHREGVSPPMTPSPTSAVVIHASPDSKRLEARAGRRLDDILQGVAGADYLVERVQRDEVPHLVTLMQKKAATLLASQGTARDSKAQVADWQVWRNLARFCGQACLDDGAGAHAFTRADVLKLPLEHRLNMLAALDGAHALQRVLPSSEPATDATQVLATFEQAHGLASAFSDKELLPPGDEVRANALKARLHAISDARPGAPFCAETAAAVIQAHHDAYQLTGKPVAVVLAKDQAAPFTLSSDRRTLQVSAQPRPADEAPAAIVHRLVAELTRNYQQQLVERMNSGSLDEADDRFMLAALLQASGSQQADAELLASRPLQLPVGARSRHAQLHAARVVRF